MTGEKIIIAGQAYRVEVNWNTIVSYLEQSGQNDVTALANFGSLKPSDIAGLLAAAINEGERLEGREVSFTAKEIGSRCGMKEIADFIRIFSAQTAPQVQSTGSKKND